MHLSVSNLAWDTNQRDAVVKLLVQQRVSGVELAPSKIWPDPYSVSVSEISKERTYWNTHHIHIAALQSIFYSKPELNLFGDSHTRDTLYRCFARIITLAQTLHSHYVVFGSPKNKHRGSLNTRDANTIATDFFYRLGQKAKAAGVYICIEATPHIYHTDFLTSTTEVLEFVQIVKHPYIQMNLDISAASINHEDIPGIIRHAAPFIKHIHISEEHFGPIRPGAIPHVHIAEALSNIGYTGWISIEMQANDTTNNLANIDESLSYVNTAYGSI